jgi:hypothetical protein
VRFGLAVVFIRRIVIAFYEPLRQLVTVSAHLT